MAQATTIQYVQFYTAGSAARKVEPTVQVRTAPRPKAKKQKKIIIRIDPVATLGILVAVMMLVLMISGIGQLNQAYQQTQAMEAYVQTLQQENAALQAEYSAGYDIAEVEKMALALGMVPAEDVAHVDVRLSVPQEPQSQNLNLWESVTTFLTGLFA